MQYGLMGRQVLNESRVIFRKSLIKQHNSTVLSHIRLNFKLTKLDDENQPIFIAIFDKNLTSNTLLYDVDEFSGPKRFIL
jgi:hypothetical protein